MILALPQLNCGSRPAQGVHQGTEIVSLTWGLENYWKKYVEAHPEGTAFHSLEWRNAVRAAFRHSEEYLVALHGRQIIGVLPLFLVKGPVIGRMLVSVPYAVGGGILSDDAGTAEMLFAEARRRAAEHRGSLIDLRSERAQVAELPINGKYVGFERELPNSAVDVEDWLPRKARAMVRNAREKYGLTCALEPESLRTVWKLYCRNMRRLASINYPFRFFECLAVEFGDRCQVSVVRRMGRPVAGLVTFLFRDRVLPYFFGCEEEARKYGAANFIYACAMARGVANGYSIFDFGRSRRDNIGSCDFKRFQGFEPRPLQYQRLVMESSKPVDLTPTNPALGLARKIWTRLPLEVTRPAGAFLANYIPG